MTGNLILSRFQAFGSQFGALFQPNQTFQPNLHTVWLHPELLPKHARENPTLMRILELLGPLDWGQFPERNLQRHWRQPAISYAAFAGALLNWVNAALYSHTLNKDLDKLSIKWFGQPLPDFPNF